MPRVTVILTSYNHAPYLRSSIESVLRQTFSDFELIVWDDASTDESWEIIQRCTDSRVRRVRNERRQGMIYGVNRAISEMSRAEFIAIQHSDDLWEPGKLAAQVDFLDRHPEHGAVFTGVHVIDEHGNPFTDRSHPYFSIFDQPQRNRHEWLRFFFLAGNGLCHPSVLIRRAFFDEYGLYRRGLSQMSDYDAWIRLCMHWEIHVLPEKLVQFRVRAGETNASGGAPEHVIRTDYERFRALDNFRELSNFEELAAVFPEAGKYRRSPAPDALFALGMLAVEARADRQTVLFGLGLLFEALNDPSRAMKLMELYDFDAVRYRELTASCEIFSDYQSIDQLRQARRMLEQLQDQLGEIEISAGWKSLQVMRRVRLWMVPPGSTREKVWYAILSRARGRPQDGTA